MVRPLRAPSCSVSNRRPRLSPTMEVVGRLSVTMLEHRSVRDRCIQYATLASANSVSRRERTRRHPDAAGPPARPPEQRDPSQRACTADQVSRVPGYTDPRSGAEQRGPADPSCLSHWPRIAARSCSMEASLRRTEGAPWYRSIARRVRQSCQGTRAAATPRRPSRTRASCRPAAPEQGDAAVGERLHPEMQKFSALEAGLDFGPMFRKPDVVGFEPVEGIESRPASRVLRRRRGLATTSVTNAGPIAPHRAQIRRCVRGPLHQSRAHRVTRGKLEDRVVDAVRRSRRPRPAHRPGVLGRETVHVGIDPPAAAIEEQSDSGRDR